VRSGPGKNEQEPKKKKYNGQQQKELDCHEPHPAPNEKTQPIQWTERPTGALVAVNSLWPTSWANHSPSREGLTHSLANHMPMRLAKLPQATMPTNLPIAGGNLGQQHDKCDNLGYYHGQPFLWATMQRTGCPNLHNKSHLLSSSFLDENCLGRRWL